MNKVITVNLNGNAYQVDEEGYDALREYLNRAEAQLRDNVDRREVIADLEQAIGDKCASALRPHKNVLTAAEIAQILNEIGPVQNVDGEPVKTNTQPPPKSNANDSAPHVRRLYRIRQGSGWCGVCRGLAAYTDVDVVVVRIMFVLATIFSGGFGLLVYIVMTFLVPVAYTESQLIAAHAVPPELRRS
jgi:phage shock protein PspC (stress-responsive transcriptional regulator)